MNSNAAMLQFGAFGGQANAEQLLEKLKVELGALAEGVKIHVGEGLYRRRVGPFESSAEANALASQLRRVTDIQPISCGDLAGCLSVTLNIFPAA